MTRDMAVWLARKPGPFAHAVPDVVRRQAWRSLNKHGLAGGLKGELDFMHHLNKAGFDLRESAFGGWVLDKCQS